MLQHWLDTEHTYSFWIGVTSKSLFLLIWFGYLNQRPTDFENGWIPLQKASSVQLSNQAFYLYSLLGNTSPPYSCSKLCSFLFIRRILVGLAYHQPVPSRCTQGFGEITIAKQQTLLSCHCMLLSTNESAVNSNGVPMILEAIVFVPLCFYKDLWPSYSAEYGSIRTAFLRYHFLKNAQNF